MALGTPVTATVNTVSSVVVVASAARLSKLVVVNNNGGLARWIQIFNATSLPPNGATPTLKPLQQVSPGNTVGQSSQVAAAGGSTTFDLGPNGVQFDQGIVVAASSTPDTLTVITSNDCNFTTSYEPPGP